MCQKAVSPLATDAITLLWMSVAAEAGWQVIRTTEAYASSDGEGRLLIGVDEVLDADDAPAQLIFHELCHALTQGPSSWSLPDWGLSNADPRDVVAEHACLCVHVLLSSPFGLRAAMAPTTEYRAYHDALKEDDIAGSLEPAPARARAALALPGNAKMRAGLIRGLAAAHGEGDGLRTDPAARAGARWEAPVDCQACGACCREAYHSVTVSVRDPVVWKQPDLVVRHGHRFEIRREGPRCAALDDRRAAPVPALPLFSCGIYDDRPRPCRDFEANGRHCLVARRRVGLSP